MGVTRLNNFLVRDNKSFKSYELHDEHIIICGTAFITKVENDCCLLYGGEFSSLYEILSKYIKNLLNCDIIPIFIFKGLDATKSLSRYDLIRRTNQRLLAIDKIRKSQNKEDYLHMRDKPLPFLAKDVLVEVLNDYNILYYVSDTNTNIELSSLGMYFNCPILSSNSDFYLYRHSLVNQGNYFFVPIAFFNPEEILKYNNKCKSAKCVKKGCYFIPCKIFSYESSKLNVICEQYLPFFAALLGINDIGRLSVPKYFLEKMRDVNSIIDYVSRIQRCPYIIKNLVLRKQNLEILYQSYKKYTLSTLDIISGKEKLIANHTNVVSQLLKPFEPSDDILENLSMYMQGFYIKENYNPVVCDSWPESLLEAYRTNQMDIKLLTALYDKDGCFNHICVQSNSNTSPFSSSVSLRSLYYSFIYNILKEYNDQAYFPGVMKNHVKEYFYIDGSIYGGLIKLTDFSARQNLSFDEILNQYAGIYVDPSISSLPHYLSGLSVICTYFLANGNCNRIWSVSAVIAVCFLSVVFNENKTDKKTLTEVKNYFSEFIEQVLYAEKYPDIGMIELFYELQAIHYVLMNLYKIISCCCETTSSIEFAPVWLTFPSFKAAYALLKSVPTMTTRVIEQHMENIFHSHTVETYMKIVKAFEYYVSKALAKSEERNYPHKEVNLVQM